MAEMETESAAGIATTIEEAVGWIVITNPKRHNAMSMRMWLDVPGAIARLEADPAVRVIVLRGAGSEAFVSGADISEFGTVRRDAESSRAYEAANIDAFAAIRTAAKPTVAMIRGFCMGGGMGLAAACDIRIGAGDGAFAIPAARLGLAYPPEAIGDFVRLIGAARTKDLIFTARRFDAAEARALGFLDHLVEPDQIEAFTRDYAATVAGLAPLTQQAAKRPWRPLPPPPANRPGPGPRPSPPFASTAPTMPKAAPPLPRSASRHSAEPDLQRTIEPLPDAGPVPEPRPFRRVADVCPGPIERAGACPPAKSALAVREYATDIENKDDIRSRNRGPQRRERNAHRRPSTQGRTRHARLDRR
ncbi:putative enoyl-CoA hydratase echA8 [Methylobrevis pamukkalensis]|uniref:Putative enoyl-CoA hydratase echA8 n=2 Tax=Methylobrevis pamukkalensis TaxID=1439726 RepID=A0A1E3GXE7_9HYPH|nr:putative enoyl-CoA hydratase echA8 [Methylobrevis pamukkalensis]